MESQTRVGALDCQSLKRGKAGDVGIDSNDEEDLPRHFACDRENGSMVVR